MSKWLRALVVLAVCALVASCARPKDPNTLVMIIESSPANLDPRVGTDAQSERIYKLLFDSLVKRDENFDLKPWLAERWDIPDPKTYVFHLRRDAKFHNGAQVTSRDVKWTLDSIMNGSLVTAKASTFKLIEAIETPDEFTVVIKLKEPYATLLWNVSDGAVGIVPYGSDKSLSRAPIGSGPFKYVSSEADNYVLIERNDQYWGEKPKLSKVRFNVIPDTTTRALELRKGSADAAINAMSSDMAVALKAEPDLEMKVERGTIYMYLAFNLRDPVLKDARVREALAYATNRKVIIHSLWRDMAEPANSLLPVQHWAYDATLPKFEHDPARANKILDDAGYKRTNGTRFRLTMKTSTEETTRLLAAVLQQQWREVGVQLDIRTFEFGTFYSDVVKGAFQVYSLRWIGGNEDPDIFEHVFHSASFPPKRANRSYYVNKEVDELIDAGRKELDREKRRAIYVRLQQIISKELPYVHLWYLNNVLIHNKRVKNVKVPISGSYDFLRTAELVN